MDSTAIDIPMSSTHVLSKQTFIDSLWIQSVDTVRGYSPWIQSVDTVRGYSPWVHTIHVSHVLMSAP